VRILILVAVALVAMTPSLLFAWLYLRMQKVFVPLSQTIERFMDIAPGPLKIVLVTQNFVLMGLAIYGIVLFG
jgi:hypothetical protein